MAKIMVVDDKPEARELVISLIRSLGFEDIQISESSTGNDAWERIQADTPDFLITDINMPGINGIQLAQKVRSKFKKCILIIVSNSAGPDYEDVARKISARFFPKSSLNGGGNSLKNHLKTLLQR